MKKKIYLILLLILIISCFFIYYIEHHDKKGFYTIKGDNIKNITKIVGKRELIKKDYEYKNSVITKTYKYKNVKDPYTDLSLYIDYLKSNSNFMITKNYDLNNKKDDIELSRNSNKKGYIVIIKIKYNSNSYTIKIIRGKGKIKLS